MLEVKAITKDFGSGRAAVHDLSFNVQAGEKVALLGVNGAGKTTSFRMITGLLRPDSGEVCLLGKAVHQNTALIQKKIGYLPEVTPLYPELTCKEQLTFAAGLYKIESPQRRLMELREMCGLEEVWNRPSGKFSKGYRQRLALALSLIHDPELLILDEPTSGLDLVQVKQFRKLIANISSNKALILSTHIMSEVEANCDRSLIINKGKLVDETTLPILSENIYQFEWKGESWPKGFFKLKSTKDLKDHWKQSRIHLPKDRRPETFLEEIKQAGLELRSFAPCQETLEDRFLDVIQQSGAEEKDIA